MILGLDISTSVVGISLFHNDEFKLYELSYIKFKDGTNLFIKLDEFIKTFEERYSDITLTQIFIEEPLKKFKGKFSSADTIQKLTQINSMISGYLYRKHKLFPIYFNVSTARKSVFKDLSIPQSHPNKKHLVWEAVMKAEPMINWKYSTKTHALMKENYDMCDAYVVGMAGIIMLIKQKTNPVDQQIEKKKISVGRDKKGKTIIRDEMGKIIESQG